MKKKTIFIVIGIVLGLALIIFLLSRIPKREFNTFTFPTSMVVENFTDNEMVDTITMVILNKLLEYDTMRIGIYPMPPIFEKDDKTEYIAFVAPTPFDEHRYNLYLKKNARLGDMINVLPHEMVHLKQFEAGRLQVIEGHAYIWEGDTTLYVDVEYNDRPYEREAFTLSPVLKRKLNSILYKPRK